MTSLTTKPDSGAGERHAEGRTATPQAALSRPFVVSRVVYGTITLMSVLIVYGGWEQLRFRDVVAVIVGPVPALFLCHSFAATLAKQVEHGKVLTGAERGGRPGCIWRRSASGKAARWAAWGPPSAAATGWSAST
jgi:hypothetical protein